MEKEGLTKTAMAARMRTSRRALDRLLDPRNTSVTLHTMQKAAAALGRRPSPSTRVGGPQGPEDVDIAGTAWLGDGPAPTPRTPLCQDRLRGLSPALLERPDAILEPEVRQATQPRGPRAIPRSQPSLQPAIRQNRPEAWAKV